MEFAQWGVARSPSARPTTIQWWGFFFVVGLARGCSAAVYGLLGGASRGT